MLCETDLTPWRGRQSDLYNRNRYTERSYGPWGLRFYMAAVRDSSCCVGSVVIAAVSKAEIILAKLDWAGYNSRSILDEVWL